MAVKPESIIIGIHGLAKKPNKATLNKWWKTAICEYLNHNIPKYKNNKISPSQLNFSMVYWNDLMGSSRILTMNQLIDSDGLMITVATNHTVILELQKYQK